jgi:hypothetical protein
MAIRISQVIAVESPRKFFQFRCAFRKHSCVSVSARSTSLSDASRKRKICGRWLSTMPANSRAAISSAASAVIGFTAIPAAIGLVDVPIRRKFTAPTSIFPQSAINPSCGKPREAPKPIVLMGDSNAWLRGFAPGLAALAMVSARQRALAMLPLGNGIIRCGGMSIPRQTLLVEAVSLLSKIVNCTFWRSK